MKRMRPIRPYRAIFNFDTSGVIGQGYQVIGDANTTNEYMEQIYGHAAFSDDSHVDAVFWHDGAGGNTANWDSDVLELTAQRIGKVAPLLLKLIAEGNDPPKVAVRECKKRGRDVFYSFRFNDCHDSADRPQLLATFKVQHPEWTIGKGLSDDKSAKGHPYGGHRNLNFAIHEVCDLKFAVIGEVFRKYDFDGLEIDFLRSPPYFIPGDEPKNAHILTELLRRTRDHLNQRGEDRGRPITLAVRVDETLEACRLDGFDAAAWVNEGLIDILVLGSGAIDIEVEEFKKLTGGTDVLVYPCLYGGPSGYRPISIEMARALAVNYWYQGADGIYLFNYGPLFSEIGDPEAMRGKDKFFAADRGRPAWQYAHNWMHCVLPVTLETGKQVKVPIMVGEDLTKPPPPKKIVFRIACDAPSDNDKLEIQLNANPLAELRRSGKWRMTDLKPHQLKLGRNQVSILVVKGTITISSLEIHVSYSQPAINLSAVTSAGISLK